MKNDNTSASVTAENMYGILKEFHDKKRAEKYELRQQLKFLCATVANQLACELASEIEYKSSQNTRIENFKFDLNGRFKSGWLTAKSQIRNIATDNDTLTVFEAERYTLGKFIKKLSRDFAVNFEKNTVFFTEKKIGVNPGEKLSKVEDGLYSVLEDLPLID